MAAVVPICGRVVDGVSDTLAGPGEILIEDNRISQIVLAPGKLADVVAMQGDPIADITATAKVDFVMKEGFVCRGRTDITEGRALR